MSNVTVTPYFSEGDRYPTLIGVKADGDEYELAYVSKQQLVEMDERHRNETAELRELVRDMWACVRGNPCWYCEHYIGPENRDHILDMSECELAVQSKRLGIEVDDG